MRTLLFIDPNFSMQSPSLKSVLREWPHGFDDFDRVEVWAIRSDFQNDRIHTDFVWCPVKTWNLVSIWYWFAIHLRYFWRFIVLRQPRPTVIQSTNYYCYGADLIYLHFSHLAYGRVIRQHQGRLALSLMRKVIFWIHYAQEWLLFKAAKPRWWWVVSRQLGQECEADAGGGNFRVLPNSYDEARFNPTVRSEHREPMRRQLELGPDEVVFAFVSLGALERKGFDLAAGAVAKLNSDGCPAKLLMIGGATAEPENIAPFLRDHGIASHDFIVQVGRVPDIERYLSAADALLFPSYCEAFALVEIEAAALGLRLYLTPHYGSEMILREPGNGRLLPWTAEGIAAVLAEDIGSGAVRNSNGAMGEALDRNGFLDETRRRYREILADKESAVV